VLVNYSILVYKVVKRIPRGKVATYGQIAETIQNSKISAKFRQSGSFTFKVTPRLVGMALHENPDPENIPCHRVVNKNGKLAENYAFGGARAQRKKLLEEGVTFRKNLYVDLEKSNWRFADLAKLTRKMQK